MDSFGHCYTRSPVTYYGNWCFGCIRIEIANLRACSRPGRWRTRSGRDGRREDHRTELQGREEETARVLGPATPANMSSALPVRNPRTYSDVRHMFVLLCIMLVLFPCMSSLTMATEASIGRCSSLGYSAGAATHHYAIYAPVARGLGSPSMICPTRPSVSVPHNCTYVSVFQW